MKNIIIAIDGPAGSGKGTVTDIVAQKLNLVSIDTGATYRCIALNAIRNNITVEEKDKLIELTKNTKIEFDENKNVYLNGEIMGTGVGRSKKEAEQKAAQEALNTKQKLMSFLED